MTDHPEIPTGCYCYTVESVEYGPKTPETTMLYQIFGEEDRGVFRRKLKPCPYWSIDPTDPHNGICKFLNTDDRQNGSLLWDQVKSCDINMEE